MGEKIEQTEKECCPEFNSKKWHAKIHKWKNKKFIKESMFTIFHMPLPFMIKGKIMKMMKLAETAKAMPAKKDETLVLFHDPHAFKSEMFMSVTKHIDKAKNFKISGTFVSRVFDGPYKDTPKFMKEMDEHLAKKKKKAKRYYIHYAYCPKCSKKFGHNYVVLFAQV